MLPWLMIEIFDPSTIYIFFIFKDRYINYQIYLGNDSCDRCHQSLWPMIWNGERCELTKFHTFLHRTIRKMLDEIKEDKLVMNANT